MKKIIVTAIVSGLICGSIGAMAGSYSAKQISYTPNDSTWNVFNVSSALDNIKQTDKTEIANLQSAVSNKQATIDEMLLTYKKLDAQTTANASDIVLGKTAYKSDGTLLTGTHTESNQKGVLWNSGEYVTSATGTYTINVGFKPTKIYIRQHVTNVTNDAIVYYDSNKSTTKTWHVNFNSSTSGGYTGFDMNDTTSTSTHIISLSNTSITFRANQVATYYWVAVKE